MTARPLLAPFLACALFAAPAWGQDARPHLTVSGGTEFPVDVAARLTVELPLRLRASASVGFLPARYVGLLNDALVSAGAYPEPTAALMAATIQDSLLWRVHLGAQPFAGWGFYAEAGYAQASLGGGLTGVEAIAAATGRPLPAEASVRVEVEARATVHQLGLELGYRWLLVDRLSIQLALGGFATVAASSRLASSGAGPQVEQALAPYLVEGERYLEDTFTRYLHGGYLSLQVGVRLF